MSRVTRVVQNEWAAVKDEWLAANPGRGFDGWLYDRRVRRRAEREEADRQFSERMAEARSRAATGSATLADFPYLLLDGMRRELEDQMINGGRL